MNDKNQLSPFKLAWKLSFPVFLSYFSLGIVFGILFTHLHQPWYYAPIMSLVVYSGAVQFVAIAIMASHGSYWMILLPTFFIAARNSFYGLSLLERFQVTWWQKAYLIFGLVDTSYAIMVATKPYQDKKQDRQFCIILTTLIHSYWVAGSFIGALFANRLVNLQGLEFVLIAFFAILLFEQYLKNKTLLPFIVAITTAGIGLALLPLNFMLLFAIILSCITLTGLFYFRKKNGRS